MLTAYSFWYPFEENVLLDKLRERMQAGDFGRFEGLYIGKGQTAYEGEEIDPAESRGIGFYRWAAINPDGENVVRLNPSHWIFTSSGVEKLWRKQEILFRIAGVAITAPRYIYGD